jgi:hypothetical protein
MSGLSQHEIECRAYRLWEQAGQPQGRDKEFYVEAERQLKEEQFGPQLGSPANRKSSTDAAASKQIRSF